MGDKAGVTINKEQQIIYTKSEQSYIISRRDWKRLTRTIQKLRISSDKWSNVAWGTLGIGSSCVLSWVTGVKGTWLLVVGCTAIGVAVISFIAKHSERHQHKTSIENLKEVVLDIEEAIMSKELIIENDDID